MLEVLRRFLQCARPAALALGRFDCARGIRDWSGVPNIVYKICPVALWQEACQAGVFAGAPVDQRDGFIHFSTAAQVAETAAKHFPGAADVMLIAVDADRLGEALRFEPSRGGDLFPHLYAPLRLSAVLWAAPLPLCPDGRHFFAELSG